MARRRTPPPDMPWCIVATVAYGSILRVLKVPESYVATNNLTAYGWTVIARDSDMPPPQAKEPFFPSQQGVQRRIDNTDTEQA